MFFLKGHPKHAITFNGEKYQSKENKTILDALLRGGAEVKYSCGSGECKQCRFHLISGNIKSKPGAKGLLACQCYPISDIEISQ